MAKTITPRQSLQARGLLKWNYHDVASRSNFAPKYIERFEKNLGRMSLPENQELSALYQKHGIIFQDNMDVILEKKQDFNDSPAMSAINEIERFDVDAAALDITLNKKKESSSSDNLWVHTPHYTGPDRRNAKNQMYFSGNERRKDRQNLVQKVIDKYKK